MGRERMEYFSSSLSCNSCLSDDIISDSSSGDIVCRSCGTVLGDRLISEEAEWKDYLDDDRGTSGEGARSSMIPIDEDHGTVFIGGNKEECEFLNRLQNQTTKKELKLYESLEHLEELTFKLGINDVITERAKKLFKAAYLNGLSKLSSRETLVAAIVYYACSVSRTPRSLGEISTISGVSMKRINKMIQALTKEQSLLSQPSHESMSATGTLKTSNPSESLQPISLKPEDLIGRMASQLNISPSVVSVGRIICENIKQCDMLCGTSPQTVAVGVLLIILVATGKKWMMEHLTKVSFCSEQSIKKIYSQLQQDLILILPNDFIKSIGGISRIPPQLPSEPL